MDDITFIELSKLTGVNVYVSTTKINDGCNFFFNVNDTPNISVLDAVAASMCIPLISKPVKIDDNYYVDGCITNNLPFDIFDNINHDDILCIAVYIEDDYTVTELIESSDDLNFFMYYKQIFSIIYANSIETSYIKRLEGFKNPLKITKSHFKTFYNFEITNNSVEFNINQTDIENLILQGFTDITEYMKSFDNIDKNDDNINDDIKN